jgi:hypothetical protein
VLRSAIAAAALVASGCGTDIVLGDRPGQLTAGTYTLAFGPAEAPDCLGDYRELAGSFADLDFAAAGLIEGRLELTAARGVVTVAGEPIAIGFQADELMLIPDLLDDQPADTLLAITRLDRDGLEDTRAQVGTLALADLAAADGSIEAWASVCYSPTLEQTDQHACTVTFRATLERCCASNEP